jgi:hypothetical protein
MPRVDRLVTVRLVFYWTPETGFARSFLHHCALFMRFSSDFYLGRRMNTA